MRSLPRPRAGLRRHRVDNQVLVYDAREDRTHLLDPTTACALELLEEGGRSTDSLVAELGRRLGVPPDESLFTLALDELRKAELLDESQPSVLLSDVSRRSLLRTAGLVGASALLIPAIVTLSARPAYAAACSAANNRNAGCPCSPNGVQAQCKNGDKCCSGTCGASDRC